MEIGIGLGFRVFMVTFCADFDGFLFISLALTLAEAIVDFDHSGSRSISLSNLAGHHDATGKKNENGPAICRLCRRITKLGSRVAQ